MANDDRILLNLVLNEATVSAVEGRVRNLVNRLNNQNISININGQNFDNLISKANTLIQRMQTINATPVNINANLTSAQQQYRLETERMRVSQQLELSRQRTLQTENQAISALAQQNRTLTVNNNITHQIEQGAQNIGNDMNVAGGHARDFVTYLSDGVRYLVTYRSLYAVMNQIGEAFSEMKNVDTAAIQVRKTTGMSKDEIEAIKKASYGVATEYGRSASEYLESVSEFARAGYKQHSTELGKLSLLTQNVGDVSAESADKMLLAVDAAYQLEGNVTELTNVINALNNIANKNPTSMQKMADGLQVSASMAKTAGMDISELTALIGTGTAVTQREGAEVARAIRTIIMNVKSVKGELENGTIIDDESIAKAEAALKGVGISTKEVVNGVRELRNPMEVLDELADKWHTLGTEAKSVLTESIANKRQANVLSGILDNWSMVEKMQNEYFNSANSAIEENILYLEGWEAKSKVVSAKWTEYISNLADTKAITGTLDALYGLLTALDTPVGRIVTQIVLVNTALAVSGRLWQQIRARSIVADILSMGVAERNLGTAIQLVSGHLGRQALAWATSPFGVATIAVTGITLITSAIAKHNEKLEESRQEMIEAGKEASQLTKDLDGLVEQYRKLGEDGQIDLSDREQAKSIQEQINSLLGDEAIKVNLVNGKYEEQLKVLRKIQHERANNNYATLTDAKNAADESLRNKGARAIVNSGFNEYIDGEWEGDAVKQLLNKEGFSKYFIEATGGFNVGNYYNNSAEDFIDSYNDMIELRTRLSKSYSEEIAEGGKLHDFYKSLDKAIKDMSDAVTKYQDALDDYNINEAVIKFNETSFDGVTGALIRNEDQLKKWLSSMLASADTSDGVKQELLGLASTYFPDMSDAIAESTKQYIQNQVAAGGDITKLKNLASTCGITEQAFDDLVFATTLFNNKEIDVDSKIAKLRELGYELDVVNTKMNGYRVDLGNGHGQYVGDMQIETIDGKKYAVYYDNHNEVIKKELLTKEYGSGDGNGGGGSGGGGDKSASDKNEALDNYLKDAENRYKIHQDETKYIQELQWAHDNLTKDEKERLDIIGKINEAYRDLADNRIKDLEHQIDLKKELYGEDYDATAEWTEIQRIAHEEAERLRAMGYDNNSNEIQSLQKTWWDAENSKLEFYSKQHENIIRDIEHARDMALNADENADVTSYYRRLQEEYHKEAERLRLLDPEKYKEEIQEFQQLWWDAEKEILDHNKQVVEDFLDELQEAIDDNYDIRISRLNSQSSLLSSHFDIVNAIAEEQHNLNKELLEAQTIGAEMNEQERESLFTKEEHTRLSSKLSDIMLDVTDLQHDYQRDLETATKDTISEITNQYERQYELKMKEYEIVKAELALAKAQQVLENTKNEKSVRTWTGSGWSYAANIQDVIDAQEEVENAKYDLIKSKTEEVQQKAINVIDANADALQTEKNRLTSAIEDMAEKMEGSGKDITTMLETIAKTDLPMFDAIIQSLGSGIKDAFGISDGDINAIRYKASGASSPRGEVSILGFMQSNSEAWHTASESERRELEKANRNFADYLGLDYEESTGRWKKKDGTYAYASGTKNAKKGSGLFDEDGFGSELILTKDGILTQFDGGERVFSPEMADRLWEMAQQNYNFAPVIAQPDFSRITTIEERINNAVNNAITNNAFGDTIMIKDVHVNDSNDAVKGFTNYLKKKV